MITPAKIVSGADVAQHYDHLDRFYLDVWGEHVHHGLWLTGSERPETAVRQLVDLVGLAARIEPNVEVCDIGAGYGAAARQLAHDFGASVTALTISPRQYEYARTSDETNDESVRSVDTAAELSPERESNRGANPTYLLGDFLNNELPSERFDAACAIECASHMADPQKFASEVARILKPGGRFVMCAWVASQRATDHQVRHLLEPICREGRLAHLFTIREYVELLEDAGLTVVRFRDLSSSVRRTWSVVLKRTLIRVGSRWSYLRFLLRSSSGHRIFLMTIFRLWAAYRVGAMRYCLFVCRKPAPSAEIPVKLA